MGRKVLLINPRVEYAQSFTPHLGLAVLARRLGESGHRVSVLDYSAQRSTPPLDYFLSEFEPDVVGVSLLTAGIAVAHRVMETVLEYEPHMPIMVGGPHATLYADELATDSKISYIFSGEAENHIVEVVEKARFENKPVVINCSAQPIESFPIPDFSCFYGYTDIKVYPLLTSKGCPFQCSFCAVHKISSRLWRTRDIMTCTDELKQAKGYLPGLKQVRIIDDSPGVDVRRLKRFLRLYAQEKVNLPLEIVNIRADEIDHEMVDLMREAGVFEVCFGVEHGHPEVFAAIGKGETLEDIRRAAKLIKESGLFLRCCFVVGLPHDSFAKSLYSIRLAKELRADFFHWNSFIPLKGTRAREWFEEHGQLHNEVGAFSLSGNTDFFVPEPVAEYEDFSTEDQKKAYALAVLETDSYIFRVHSIPKIVQTAIKYNFYFAAAKSLLRQPFVWLQFLARFYQTGLLRHYAMAFLRS